MNNSLSDDITTISSAWTGEGEELVAVHDELVVARSLAEQVMLAVSCLLVGFIALGGNATTLLVTWRHHALHTAYMACVACMAIADIITSVAFTFPVGLFFATGFSLEFSRVGCWVFRFLRLFGLLLGMHLLSLLALERYIYFLHPLRYVALCSKRNMTAAVALLTAIASVMTSMGYFLGYLQFYATVGSCQLSQNSLNTTLLMAIYVLPNIFIQPFVILRIGRMLRRTRCEVAAASPDPSPPHTTLAVNLSAALRMILLTSGLFWITYLPSAVLRWALLQRGHTMDLMESLPYHNITFIFRLSNIVLFSLPPALNPFVHLYVNKELRMFTMTAMRAVRERLPACMTQTGRICIQRVAPEELHTA